MCARGVPAQAGVWRGFSAAMYRAIPVNAAIFLAVEGTRQSLQWLEENSYLGKPLPATA